MKETEITLIVNRQLNSEGCLNPTSQDNVPLAIAGGCELTTYT
jgi:hypothetical protein